MVKDAEKFAADDAKKKEEIENINQADNLIYATEKSLKDYGDKVSQTERADIEAKTNDLKSAIKEKNIDRIKKGMEELTKYRISWRKRFINRQQRLSKSLKTLIKLLPEASRMLRKSHKRKLRKTRILLTLSIRKRIKAVKNKNVSLKVIITKYWEFLRPLLWMK